MAQRTEAPTSATAGDEMFLHGLPTRVKHLETVVDSLHQDSIRTQGAISALANQVGSMVGTIKDIGDKLDAARTRKPDLGAMATWAGVLILIGSMAFAPVMRTNDRQDEEIVAIHSNQIEDAKLMGAYEARLNGLENLETRTWNTCTK